jgi:UDP:flavonoid glycosyltransferase YjiC (YdhE family)
MKILIAPLNWGLGHASRCIPLIRDYLERGDEVVLAGDGDSLLLLQRTFPTLRVLHLPSLELRYDEHPQQRLFYWRAIPALLRFSLADRYYLRQLLAREHFDLVVSDNRFGLFSRDVRCVYITHQLYPILPNRLRLFQPLVRFLHAAVYKRFDEVWVPDFADSNASLSGLLSHGGSFDQRAKYIGPLSRFSILPLSDGSFRSYAVIAVLSGLEPQRTIFEQELIERFREHDTPVLIVRGKLKAPQTHTRVGSVTLVPSLKDEDLYSLLMQAELIIARSGYSTIMDLAALGLLCKSELYPTPGQSEQEYLASLFVSSISHNCKKI